MPLSDNDQELVAFQNKLRDLVGRLCILYSQLNLQKSYLVRSTIAESIKKAKKEKVKFSKKDVAELYAKADVFSKCITRLNNILGPILYEMLNLGSSQSDASKLLEAESLLRQAKSINPYKPPEQQKKDYQELVEIYNQVLAIYPGDKLSPKMVTSTENNISAKDINDLKVEIERLIPLYQMAAQVTFNQQLLSGMSALMTNIGFIHEFQVSVRAESEFRTAFQRKISDRIGLIQNNINLLITTLDKLMVYINDTKKFQDESAQSLDTGLASELDTFASKFKQSMEFLTNHPLLIDGEHSNMDGTMSSMQRDLLRQVFPESRELLSTDSIDIHYVEKFKSDLLKIIENNRSYGYTYEDKIDFEYASKIVSYCLKYKIELTQDMRNVLLDPRAPRGLQSKRKILRLHKMATMIPVTDRKTRRASFASEPDTDKPELNRARSWLSRSGSITDINSGGESPEPQHKVVENKDATDTSSSDGSPQLEPKVQIHFPQAELAQQPERPVSRTRQSSEARPDPAAAGAGHHEDSPEIHAPADSGFVVGYEDDAPDFTSVDRHLSTLGGDKVTTEEPAQPLSAHEIEPADAVLVETEPAAAPDLVELAPAAAPDLVELEPVAAHDLVEPEIPDAVPPPAEGLAVQATAPSYNIDPAVWGAIKADVADLCADLNASDPRAHTGSLITRAGPRPTGERFKFTDIPAANKIVVTENRVNAYPVDKISLQNIGASINLSISTNFLSSNDPAIQALVQNVFDQFGHLPRDYKITISADPRSKQQVKEAANIETILKSMRFDDVSFSKNGTKKAIAKYRSRGI